MFDSFSNKVETLFVDKLNRNDGVEFQGIFSEEGGRFYHEQNRNVIMRIEDFNISPGLRDEITSAVSKRRLPHAIIVSSGTEQQRLDFALYLAAASVCSSKADVPCLVCKNCKKAFDGNRYIRTVPWLMLWGLG